LGWSRDGESVLGVTVPRDAGTTDAGVMSVRSAQMTGHQQQQKEEEKAERRKASRLVMLHKINEGHR